jgi:hypothetical protein
MHVLQTQLVKGVSMSTTVKNHTLASILKYVLVPGNPDKLVKATEGNSLNYLSRSIKFSNTAMYVGLALAVIGGVGTFIAKKLQEKAAQRPGTDPAAAAQEQAKLRKFSYAGIAAAGVGGLLTTIFAVRLGLASMAMQKDLNLKAWYDAL